MWHYIAMISYVISHVQWYPIWFHMFPGACPGRFKCRTKPAQKRPNPVQMHPCSNQMQQLSSPTSLCPLWLRNQAVVIYQSNEGIKGTLPAPPAPPSSSSLASETSPSFSTDLRRSIAVRLRCGFIPLHKLTLEKVGVGSVSFQLQDLDIDVGVRLTKACCTGISGPANVLGNHNQAGKVGDQGVHWTGQVCHVVNVAAKLRHTQAPSHHDTKLVKHEAKHRVEKCRATCWALPDEQKESWIVFVLETVGTILACVQIPVEKATREGRDLLKCSQMFTEHRQGEWL